MKNLSKRVKYLEICISTLVSLKICYHLLQDNPEKLIAIFLFIDMTLLIARPIVKPIVIPIKSKLGWPTKVNNK